MMFISMNIDALRTQSMRFNVAAVCCFSLALFAVYQSASAEDLGRLEIRVTEGKSETIPCRIHLSNEKGQVVTTTQYPFWKDHFVCDGKATLELPSGKYSWVVEKGPEFTRRTGAVNVLPNKNQTVQVKLNRIANLFSEGWVSGDMHVHRNVKDIEILMKAEDIHFAPVITWWNRPANNVTPVKQTVFTFDETRRFTKLAGEDEREGGALLFFGLNRPLDLSVKSREFPSPMTFVQQAREINPNVWIDIEKPFWWDVPVWLSTGKMNSIGIANNHMCRSLMLVNEAWGKPRDFKRLPSPRGNGYWTQEIYYHILNSGIRIPPSAGSASGVLPNPVGYNRVYVYCNDGFSRDKWFEGLRKGNSFVTNGPLLKAKANGTIPGSTFSFDSKKNLEMDFKVHLTSLDHVPQLEIVFNGKVVKTIDTEKKRDQDLEFNMKFEEPGWFLIRAITDVENTFRFASTAPWFVTNKDGRLPVSKSSAEFFLNWTKERINRVKASVKDKTERSHILKHHDQALDFWQKKVADSNRK